MKSVSRFFSFLTYGAMVYAAFTAIVAAFMLIPSASYSHFGWMILVFTMAGFLAAIVLNIFKLKWTSFFVLAGTGIARVYVSYLLVQRSGLDMLVFYKHHLPALLVVLFALLSTVFYKMHLKNERGVTFQKTQKDRELMEEKKAMQELEESEDALESDEGEAVRELEESENLRELDEAETIEELEESEQIHTPEQTRPEV